MCAALPVVLVNCTMYACNCRVYDMCSALPSAQDSSSVSVRPQTKEGMSYNKQSVAVRR